LGTPFDISIPINANTLTRVRFIEGRLLPLRPIFRSFDETFTGLSNLNDDLLARQRITQTSRTEIKLAIQNLARQNAAYARNTQFLLDKIGSIAQSLSDLLALKNQHVAQDQNNHLFRMGRISHLMTDLMVRDSATIRVITIATLAFLPSTFVAVSFVRLRYTFRPKANSSNAQTLFGSQLFYLTPTHTLEVSPHIWIFFAISIPLTIVTMAWWLSKKRNYENKISESDKCQDEEKATRGGKVAKEGCRFLE
jgi:hypothetical protein